MVFSTAKSFDAKGLYSTPRVLLCTINFSIARLAMLAGATRAVKINGNFGPSFRAGYS